jgi:transposase InsO family protein
LGISTIVNSFDNGYKTFVAWAENQTSERMQALHLDHSREYISGELKSFLAKKGIEHCLTMPGSPQQNGVAKRWNWTILDKTHISLHSTGLSLDF